MKNMLRTKRITAVIIIAALLVLFGKGNIFTKTVYAEGEKTISGLCTGAISNPIEGDGGWSYVYYGTYGGSNIKYRVLDTLSADFNSDEDNSSGRKTMLLDCDSVLNWMHHDFYSPYTNLWVNSDVRTWLNGNGFYGSTDVFTIQEKAAIASSTKASPATGDMGGQVTKYFDFAELAGDHIFLLDAVEATRPSYGYTDWLVESMNRNKSGQNAWWWLRSPWKNTTGYMGRVGYTGSISRDPVGNSGGVCPVFNLNLDSVIFSSVISGTAGSAGAEYKLTVADDNLGITPGTVTRSGTTITVPYKLKVTNTSHATRVSVLIMDSEYSAGTAVTSGYTYLKLSTGGWGNGPIADANGKGSGTFTLPASYEDKICGIDYYVYILAEYENTGKATDYASVPTPVAVPNLTSTVTFDANGGSGSMNPIEVSRGLYTLPQCTFTAPEGKEFDKWDKGAVGDRIIIADDTIIKAQWKEKFVSPDPVAKKEIAVVEYTSNLADLLASHGESGDVSHDTNDEKLDAVFGMWQRKTAEGWKSLSYEDRFFTPGSYRQDVTICLYDDSYCFAKNVKLLVDGQEWTYIDGLTDSNGCLESVTFMSPEFEVKDNSTVNPDPAPTPTPNPNDPKPETGNGGSNPAETAAPKVENEAPEPKPVDTAFTDEEQAAEFVVTSADKQNPTVDYKCTTNKKVKKITVPQTVTLEGVTYNVTGIASKAFNGCKKLKTISFGNNIENIRANAFKGAKNLKTINAKSSKLTKDTLAKKAFKGIGSGVTVKVPKKMKKTYEKLFVKKGLSKSVKIK